MTLLRAAGGATAENEKGWGETKAAGPQSSGWGSWWAARGNGHLYSPLTVWGWFFVVLWFCVGSVVFVVSFSVVVLFPLVLFGSQLDTWILLCHFHKQSSALGGGVVPT